MSDIWPPGSLNNSADVLPPPVDATGGGVVTSVTNVDGTLTISPTTGAVIASLNLAHANTWTATQTNLQASSSWVATTSSTSSATTLGLGAYFVSNNTSGLIGAIGAHTTAYSNPGTIFLADQYTMESYGTGGTAIAAWGTGADIIAATANGGATANECWRTLSTGTTVYKAGSTAAGTAPIKFTSGALQTSPAVGAVEFLTDKYYATITTGAARKELALWDSAGTSGRVPFATTNGRLLDSANFLWDNANVRLNLFGAATTAGNDIFASKSTNGQMACVFQNTSNGTGAYSGFLALNDGGANMALLKTSSGYTTAGLVVASQNYLVGSAGSVLFGTSGAADIIFVTGGTATTNERLRIKSASGTVIAGATATPAGGTAGLGLSFGSTSNFGVFFGSGAPSLAAAKGSLYLRSDGTTTNDRMYVNTNGSTTWTAVTTAA